MQNKVHLSSCPAVQAIRTGYLVVMFMIDNDDESTRTCMPVYIYIHYTCIHKKDLALLCAVFAVTTLVGVKIWHVATSLYRVWKLFNRLE